MFAIPLACILASRKLLGSATNIDNKTLNIFAEKIEDPDFQKALLANPDEARKNFITTW
jgi:hypothetical protein